MADQATRFRGPLRASSANPRYFADGSGKAIYLTGSHTWATLVDIKAPGDQDFDYGEWLNLMEGHHHNFLRLWTWDHTRNAPWTQEPLTFDPMPFERTGPGLALDGGPKFDLSKYNQAYFDRLRSRVIQAGERGIYVSVMLFEAWCVHWSTPEVDSWFSHPYHKANNVNGVDGDPDGDGHANVYTTVGPEVIEFQKAYVRKVVDTVNDLDNVLYEIINETWDDEPGMAWHNMMVDYVLEYEATKPRQHPVGMTSDGRKLYNPVLFASNADWVSPSPRPGEDYRYDPPVGDGSKVVLSDTDHLWGHGGTYQWAWKSFLRGLNPIFMDPWSPTPGRGRPRYPGGLVNSRDYPDWALLRINMGHTRRFAERLDLNVTLPHSELATSGFCLAEPGKAYLVYQPNDAQVGVDLSAADGQMLVEWFNPRTAEHAYSGSIEGGGNRHMVSPFGMDVVLFIHKP